MGEPCWVGAARTISSIGILVSLPGTTGFLSPPLVCSRNPSKALNLHKNGYIQALVYGKKPGLPGICVVDSVYYYSVYRYYKMIMTHNIYFLMHSLGIHTHSLSYSGRGAQTSPAEHLPAKTSSSQQAAYHIRLFLSLQVTQLDPNKSLLEVKLYPQETLFLEAKE